MKYLSFRFVHFGGQWRNVCSIGAFGGTLVRHVSICSIGGYGGTLVRPLSICLIAAYGGTLVRPVSICLIFVSVDVGREHAGLGHFRVGVIFAHRKVL